MTSAGKGGFTMRFIAIAVALFCAAWAAAERAAAEPHHEITAFSTSLSDYQAAGHPDAVTEFELGMENSEFGLEMLQTVKGGAPKDVFVELPQGVSGNPVGVPRCQLAQLVQLHCPTDSQVGRIKLQLILGGEVTTQNLSIFNMQPDRGEVAHFGFSPFTGATTAFIGLYVRPRGDGRYVINADTENINDGVVFQGAKVELWGVPASPVHTPERSCTDYNPMLGCEATIEEKAYFTAPSDCSTVEPTRLRVRSYQFPTDDDWTEGHSTTPAVTGCSQVPFEPSIEARPTTNLADTPTGLEVKLHLPQNEDPNGLAQAYLRDVTMTLPEGLTVNPSSAAGLGACTMAQVGISADGRPNMEEAACPLDSKLGNVRLDTPAVDHPLFGGIYLAKPHDNPFGSLIALYIVVDDKETGLRIKLPGKVEPDPQTGRLRAVFKDNPQLPFEDMTVSFFGGPRASLKTPATCGTFTTTGELVPWTAPEGATAHPSDSYTVSRGANDSACVGSDRQLPHTVTFSGGTIDPSAAAYTPFVMKLARPDGSQRLKAIETTLPMGLVAKLAGVPYCPDAALAAAAARDGKAEQASPSCPAASRVGTVDVGAGAGSQPLYVQGAAYLAGPYKGAPLSLAIVTPAVAGPFDLGTVVVRTALYVDPETTQIRAVSDPLPTILQGIPLEVRSVAVTVDRPSFTLNPTSCDPTQVLAGALSVFDATTTASSPFQVGGCASLRFGPKLTLRLKGGVKRSKYPALRAVVTAEPGQANIGRVSVAMPRALFLAQEHIKTVCTRVQYRAGQCPPGAVYGKARAVTPLLDEPLEGPVYLRSSDNPLPDLVVALKGQINVDLVGRIDSHRGGIRTTFDTVPDAAFSRFVLEMPGGKKSLLVNSRNFCSQVFRATVEVDGQNGKTADQRPAVVNPACKKLKPKRGKGRRGAAR